MDLPFLSMDDIANIKANYCFNPYSNGSSFFIRIIFRGLDKTSKSFNPYSNGSSFFIHNTSQEEMTNTDSFNPYSNGSSFFIPFSSW